MSRRIAFFDIDGTITRHSSERLFIRYLLQKKIISYSDLVLATLRYSCKHPTNLKNGFKQNKMYLRGLDAEMIRQHAAQCFDEFIRPSIKPLMTEAVETCRKDGYTIVLLSGSLRCLAEPMQRFTQAEDLICSETEIVNNRYTGEMSSLHPYGENKKTLAIRYCTDHQIAERNCRAYANEWADRFLMEAVGEAVAVDPDENLERLARIKKWKQINIYHG